MDGSVNSFFVVVPVFLIRWCVCFNASKWWILWLATTQWQILTVLSFKENWKDKTANCERSFSKNRTYLVSCLFWIIFAIYAVIPSHFRGTLNSGSEQAGSASALQLFTLVNTLVLLLIPHQEFSNMKNVSVWCHLASMLQHSSLTAVTTEALLPFPSFSVCQHRKAALGLCCRCDNLQGVVVVCLTLTLSLLVRDTLLCVGAVGLVMSFDFPAVQSNPAFPFQHCGVFSCS